jgi:hypothetical protein
LPRESIVAVGLLTKRDASLLGPAFARLWPVEQAPCFSGLLQAIDAADRELGHRNRELACREGAGS